MTNDSAADSVRPKLVGLGGWLILPSIGLVLGGIMSLITTFFNVLTYPKMLQSGYGGYCGLKIAIQIGMFIYLVFTASRFFARKKTAPSTMIGLMTAGIATSLLSTIVAHGANAKVFGPGEISSLIWTVVSSSIWISYFKTSKRVAATFTK